MGKIILCIVEKIKRKFYESIGNGGTEKYCNRASSVD